jgi:hypothetical protein
MEGSPDVLCDLGGPGFPQAFSSVDFVFIDVQLLDASPFNGEASTEKLRPADTVL